MTRQFAAKCKTQVSADFSFESLLSCKRKLESAGILREVTGRTRDRIYLAPDILRLMTDDAATARRDKATT